eukprot:Nk52_evm124s352 gene=Nk52_evmTU124s352
MEIFHRKQEALEYSQIKCEANECDKENRNVEEEEDEDEQCAQMFDFGGSDNNNSDGCDSHEGSEGSFDDYFGGAEDHSTWGGQRYWIS